MGWDLALCKDGRAVPVPAHQEGSNVLVAYAPQPVPGVASLVPSGEVWVRAGAARDLDQMAPAVARALQAGLLVPLQGRGVAEVTVTYNYREHFDFGCLHGLMGGDSVPLLVEALARLEDRPHDDYWETTAGNAGHMCAVLLSWAILHPVAFWQVS